MSNNATTPAATGNAPSPAVAQAPPAGTAGDQNILAADDFSDDDGSSISHQSLTSSTTSITSSILDYRKENGRTYHAYKDGKYTLPNDDQEHDRLDLQHNMFIRSFHDKLGTAPPNELGAKVGRVLDVGTGSGIWAIDFGDDHPEADVTGVDLSPVPTDFVPPNVKFEVDDVEESWTFSQPFDYIHSRLMTGSISNWEKYIRECYKNLSPGGYLELNEGDAVPLSDDGTLTEDSSLMKAVRLWCEALAALGSPFEDVGRLVGVMKDVGFEDVHINCFKWPTNPWAKDHRHKELGIWNYENLSPNLEGFFMAPLTRGLDWTREEVLLLAMEARKDLGNRNIHAYYKMWSIYGRKPLKVEEEEEAPPAAAEAPVAVASA
ncbi:methyltransferase [Colletotrichum higginsianum]|uniref:Methyltransferase n=1 Tax=Colletotrichum higginsianum (strain IMI 349063) TaxID=759273 RepID=H1VZJ3_COLHI|nr:Methyltransferase [Colletotrichum higginsianum IMI 349063]OBR11499.1 Methyltransferase [Colletotrichum higginsianum IMI 349063]CCF45655.1 methyltransferase [Colletotrichum higginsianum]